MAIPSYLEKCFTPVEYRVDNLLVTFHGGEESMTTLLSEAMRKRTRLIW